jgi:hypothetical protein
MIGGSAEVPVAGFRWPTFFTAIKILPPFVRQALIRASRAAFGRPAIARRRDFPRQPAPVSLHMVVGQRMLEMGLLTLRSLEFHTGRTWAAVIHDDGTLGDADIAAVQTHFPDARVIRRAEADAALDTALASHPTCRAYRGKHNWFLKNFDTWFFAPHDRYIVIDSDIVFFRRPDHLLRWVDDGADTLWVMEDTTEKYALPREDIEALLGFPLWQKVNSGLDLMPRPAFDLDLAERYLTACGPAARHFQFLEQTFFAVTGAAWGRGGTLPREYEISWGNFRRRDSVCRHYVGPFKDDLLWVEGGTTFFFQSRHPSAPAR